MLRKPLGHFPLLALFALAPTLALADDDQSKADALREQIDASNTKIEAAMTEFRDIVCKRALNFGDELQDRAIDIAQDSKFVDVRFDDVIRKNLKSASKPNNWNTERIETTLHLIPLSTLGAQEQVELAFKCYLQCDGKSSQDRSVVRSLVSLLGKTPDETSRVLHKHLQEAPLTSELLSLCVIAGEASEEILPIVVAAAESSDADVAEAAMRTAPDMITLLRRKQRQLQSEASALAEGVSEIDSKMVSYAKRIISRYDKNDDSVLTPNEYGSMLISPVTADTDGNGKITVREYAVYMEKRSRR